MFEKNKKILFGTMYPNQKIAMVTDLTTDKKTLYKLQEVTRRDKPFYKNETFMLDGKEYVATRCLLLN